MYTSPRIETFLLKICSQHGLHHVIVLLLCVRTNLKCPCSFDCQYNTKNQGTEIYRAEVDRFFAGHCTRTFCQPSSSSCFHNISVPSTNY